MLAEEMDYPHESIQACDDLAPGSRLHSGRLLGLGFILAGANHFLHPGFYVRMMPPYLPWHLGLVYLSQLTPSPVNRVHDRGRDVEGEGVAGTQRPQPGRPWDGRE
jgi:hypothetical protein